MKIKKFSELDDYQHFVLNDKAYIKSDNRSAYLVSDNKQIEQNIEWNTNTIIHDENIKFSELNSYDKFCSDKYCDDGIFFVKIKENGLAISLDNGRRWVFEDDDIVNINV